LTIRRVLTRPETASFVAASGLSRPPRLLAPYRYHVWPATQRAVPQRCTKPSAAALADGVGVGVGVGEGVGDAAGVGVGDGVGEADGVGVGVGRGVGDGVGEDFGRVRERTDGSDSERLVPPPATDDRELPLDAEAAMTGPTENARAADPTITAIETVRSRLRREVCRRVPGVRAASMRVSGDTTPRLRSAARPSRGHTRPVALRPRLAAGVRFREAVPGGGSSSLV
jgi:hypothetical protein